MDSTSFVLNSDPQTGHSLANTIDPQGNFVTISAADFQSTDWWVAEVGFPHGIIKSREKPIDISKPLANANLGEYTNVSIGIKVNSESSLTLSELETVKYQGQFYYNARLCLPKAR